MSLLSRTLLVVLYIFLLAPQCHSRFYSVANVNRFTAHQSTLRITAVKAELEHVAHIKVKHLRLDKRFKNANTYYYFLLHPGTGYAYAYPVIKEKNNYPSFIDLYRSVHLRCRLLRGPPCA